MTHQEGHGYPPASDYEPKSHVEHIASALFGRCDLNRVWLGMMRRLTGYFDASGSNSDEEAITVGGFVATPREWSKFHCDWRGVLDPIGVDIFHMVEFRQGLQGSVTDWTSRQRVLCHLARIIAWRAKHSAASTVRLSDWREVNEEYQLKECHATPYAMASMLCILKTLEAAESAGLTTNDVEFVFEKGDNGQGDLQWFLDRVLNEHLKRIKSKERPIEPAFKSKSRDLSMLQAADFAAWEQRNAVMNELSSDQWSTQLNVMLKKFSSQWGVIHAGTIREQAIKTGIPKRSVALGQRELAKWRPGILKLTEPS